MAGILAYDIDPPLATDQFAGRATRLDRCLDFHFGLQTARDARLAAVGVELEEYFVAHQHLDAV